MSFSRFDEAGARTSHRMHCCIGAHRATHCATGATVIITNKLIRCHAYICFKKLYARGSVCSYGNSNMGPSYINVCLIKGRVDLQRENILVSLPKLYHRYWSIYYIKCYIKSLIFLKKKYAAFVLLYIQQ